GGRAPGAEELRGLARPGHFLRAEGVLPGGGALLREGPGAERGRRAAQLQRRGAVLALGPPLRRAGGAAEGTRERAGQGPELARRRPDVRRAQGRPRVRAASRRQLS